MEYRIAQLDLKDPVDRETFASIEYASASENHATDSEAPEDDRKAKHREELLGFVDGMDRVAVFAAREAEEPEVGAVVGTLWVGIRTNGEPWDFSNPCAWIYDIYALPSHRRKGIASALLSAGESWAVAEGFDKIGLHVFGRNTGARSLYERSGFAMLNEYVQKPLANSDLGQDSEEPVSIDEVDATVNVDFSDLCWARFEAMAETKAGVTLNDIRLGFEQAEERYLQAGKTDLALIARASDGTARGCLRAYGSRGDLGSTPYVWGRDLYVVRQGQGERRVAEALLNWMEAWARSRSLKLARVPIHHRETAAIDTLRSMEYETANVFLFKSI